MIKNYLLLAIKNLKKQKLFSLINILGLTVGITCCLLIFLFILNEFSYDNFHKNGKYIYRIMRVSEMNGDRREIPYVSAAYAPALANDFSDVVKQVVRVDHDNDLISYNNISFNEKDIYLTDNNFFTFFSFPLVKGNPKTVLKDPNSIVLTEASAKKYFGNEDPIGKILQFNKDQQLKVTGVAKDVPVNSHLQFDMVIPLEILRPMQPDFFTNFPNNTLFTYIEIKPGADPNQLEKRFPAFMDKYLGKYYATTGHKTGASRKTFKQSLFCL